jgi:uncharacterized membrane protein YhfC
VVFGLTTLFSNGIIPSPNESIVLMFNAIVLGLLAGIFEETARYILFKWIRKSSDTWQNGIVIGLGHGAIEAILIGILAIFTLAQMTAMKNIPDLSTMGISAEQIELVKNQIDSYWSQSSIVPYFGLMERMSAMSLHVGLSIFVLLSVLTNQKKWFWLALLWHALVDAFAVFALPSFSAMENSTLGIFMFESLLMIVSIGWLAFALRSRNRVPIEKEAIAN